MGGGQAAAGGLPRSRPWWAPQRSRAGPAHTGHTLLSEGSERGLAWEGGRVRPSLTAQAGGGTVRAAQAGTSPLPTSCAAVGKLL